MTHQTCARQRTRNIPFTSSRLFQTAVPRPHFMLALEQTQSSGFRPREATQSCNPPSSSTLQVGGSTDLRVIPDDGLLRSCKGSDRNVPDDGKITIFPGSRNVGESSFGALPVAARPRNCIVLPSRTASSRSYSADSARATFHFSKQHGFISSVAPSRLVVSGGTSVLKAACTHLYAKTPDTPKRDPKGSKPRAAAPARRTDIGSSNDL